MGWTLTDRLKSPDSLSSMFAKVIAGTYPMLETFGGTVAVNNALINGYIVGGWFFLPKTITISKLGYRVGSVTGSAGAVVRIGIYATNTYGHPVGAPLAEVGGVSGTATANTSVSTTLGANVQLTPGWYCTCIELQGSPSTVTQVTGMIDTIPGSLPIAAGTAPAIVSAGWFIAHSSVAGTALPTLSAATVTPTAGYRPHVFAQIASVP